MTPTDASASSQIARQSLRHRNGARSYLPCLPWQPDPHQPASVHHLDNVAAVLDHRVRMRQKRFETPRCSLGKGRLGGAFVGAKFARVDADDVRRSMRGVTPTSRRSLSKGPLPRYAKTLPCPQNFCLKDLSVLTLWRGNVGGYGSKMTLTSQISLGPTGSRRCALKHHCKSLPWASSTPQTSSLSPLSHSCWLRLRWGTWS